MNEVTVIGGTNLPRSPLSRSASVGIALAAAAVLTLMLAGAHSPIASAPSGSSSAAVAADRSYSALPLAFEENGGQAPARFDFLARSASGTAAIDSTGAVISLPAGKRGVEAISLRLVGAAPATAEPLERLPGEVNYLVGDDASKWRTGLASYERVRYADVYPGIALDWHGDQRRLEYDFRVTPGADPGEIAVRVGGASDVRVARSGALVIATGEESVRQRAPFAYQRIGGERREVDAAYAVAGNRVGFELGGYDRTRPLVIDPVVLAYSTYLGGDGPFDLAKAIAVDATGAAYVAGGTDSTDFNTVGPIEGNEADDDAFVAKLTPAGSALAYSTYLGGNGLDLANAIAVDATGAAYVAGFTDSTDFNTVGEIEGDEAGGDAFVAKLNPAGSVLTYSTYLGGDGSDQANAIAVDSAGAAYIAGLSESTDFNTIDEIEGDEADRDAFIAKLNPTGSGLAYSTYLGGGDVDGANGIAVDSTGAAYVAGNTLSSDFNTVGAIEGDEGLRDTFVAKLTPAGSALTYSTYLGGGAGEEANAIAVDSAGAAYVAGHTDSSDFNTVGAIEGNEPGDDAFIAKLTPGGSALAYSTYLGGDIHDQARAIAVDSAGAAYVAGHTGSSDFNTVGEIEGDEANFDAFVAKLNPTGSALAYSSYLGGNGFEHALAVAVDAEAGAYVAGATDSTDFNTVGEVEGDEPGGDAFIAKLVGDADLAISKSESADPAVAGEVLTYTISVFNSGPSEAVGVTVEDPIPAGAELVSASPECAESAGVVTCDLGSLSEGQSDSVVVRVRPSAAGLLVNTAAVDAINVDPVAVDDTDTEETTIEAAPEPPEPPEPPLQPQQPPKPQGTCAGRAATIVGTDGRDDIVGTEADDVIDSGGRRDEIRGLGGDDVVCTGGSDDEVRGGPGADRIEGGGGTDDLRGQGGGDHLAGGRGADRLGGGGGTDVCLGGGGDDARPRGCER